MHIFEIKNGQEVVTATFARSHEHAAQLFMAWHIIARLGTLPPMEVVEYDHCRHQQHNDEALSRGVFGIARYDDHIGWTIYPPERFEEIG
ncbi:hypothetical protein MBESOW_P1919 [Sphingobium xenophagum]|uniref:Uncharacterized protein n=2 Tax=Sphingobium xenophagum TaxID=121428 RepID=A0A401J219_SPHXE|nr:hypothetical protein MBESOW_P1919 [Sphingobium xenophagum]